MRVNNHQIVRSGWPNLGSLASVLFEFLDNIRFGRSVGQNIEF